MSNVTKITTSKKMRLPTLEAQIAELYETQRKANWDIGTLLLQIKSDKEWQHKFEFFAAYLEDLNDRLGKQNVWIGVKPMQQYIATAEFAANVEAGRIPAKYKAFFRQAAPNSQNRIRHIAQDIMKDAATPISEAAALKICFDEGYFDLNDPDPIRRDDVTAIITKRKRGKDPELMAGDFTWEINRCLEMIDAYEWDDANFQIAIRDASFRKSAKGLHALLGEILSIKSIRG